MGLTFLGGGFHGRRSFHGREGFHPASADCCFPRLLALPALAQTPQKAFTRDDLAAQAAQVEERLKREVSPPANADIARLLREGNAALERDNARAALPLANQAVVVAPRDPNAWRLLARAAKP